MFTGLIEEVGTIQSVRTISGGKALHIRAQKVLTDMQLGASIAVDGVCLSVVEKDPRGFVVQAVRETLERTTIDNFRQGTRVNLERAVLAGERLGGHIVQGHVDGTGRITEIKPVGEGIELRLTLPGEMLRYCVEKGAIAVNGVSLTVARMSETSVTIALIPLTLRETNLGQKRVGDEVNVEVDILAKYAAQYSSADHQSGLSLSKITRWGFNRSKDYQ